MIGVVEDIGADVRTLKRGDTVIMTFACSDGTCVFCKEGLYTACVHVAFFGAIRIPNAHGTLFAIRQQIDDELRPGVLTTAIEIARSGGAVGRGGVSTVR